LKFQHTNLPFRVILGPKNRGDPEKEKGKMMTSMNELLKNIQGREGVYVLICGESVVYDRDSATVFVPTSNYTNASMNPLADFKSHIGHCLLWSRHQNLDCTSSEMLRSLRDAGYDGKLMQKDHNGAIYELVRPCA